MADPASPSPSPSAKPAGEPRYVVLLVLTVLGTALGALLVALAFTGDGQGVVVERDLDVLAVDAGEL